MTTANSRETSMTPIIGMDVVIRSYEPMKGTIRLISKSGKTMYVSLDIFTSGLDSVTFFQGKMFGVPVYMYHDKHGNQICAWKFNKKADGTWRMARTGESIDLAEDPYTERFDDVGQSY